MGSVFSSQFFPFFPPIGEQELNKEVPDDLLTSIRIGNAIIPQEIKSEAAFQHGGDKGEFGGGVIHFDLHDKPSNLLSDVGTASNNHRTGPGGACLRFL
ncbi:hypothetical protein CYY_009162 [Polysphondylium violaceum]|uniref:Uncharacterized protein n=1 Tax=Polysphondylium violaceum TaxID=133409 RepID=A0A8J4PMH0_9MYCE|nr:hypothetical protein CYY_009162 [Polysphondylium violaceum]